MFGTELSRENQILRATLIAVFQEKDLGKTRKIGEIPVLLTDLTNKIQASGLKVTKQELMTLFSDIFIETIDNRK